MTPRSLMFLAAIVGLLVIGRLMPSNNPQSANDAQWAQKAEESFYLSPGMGQKLLSQKEWEKYRDKMKEMPPDQLASYRVEIHRKLMEGVHNSKDGGRAKTVRYTTVQFVAQAPPFDPFDDLFLGAGTGAPAGTAGLAGSGTGSTIGGGLGAGGTTTANQGFTGSMNRNLTGVPESSNPNLYGVPESSNPNLYSVPESSPGPMSFGSTTIPGVPANVTPGFNSGIAPPGSFNTGLLPGIPGTSGLPGGSLR